LFKINELLAKRGNGRLNPNDKNSFKSKAIYKDLSENFKSRKAIEKYSERNVGLRVFVEQLAERMGAS